MTTRILVTFKQDQPLTPTHSYSLLAEIDWNTKTILRTCKFPSASFKNEHAFMSSILCGVCNIGERIFVAAWNFIVEIDYQSFEIVNAFSHPYMADLHGLATDGHNLYVTSTSIDALLCFDVNTFEFKWRWGPDEPILYQDRIQQQIANDKWASIPFLKPYRQSIYQRRAKFVDGEYRYKHKGVSTYHHHHLNDVSYYNEMLYLTTKQWNSKQKGAIIRLDPLTKESEFFVPPDSLAGLHDSVFVGENLYVTESDANGVAWLDKDHNISHRKIDPSPYFIRGLCYLDDTFLIGYSTLRSNSLPAQIVEYNVEFTQQLGYMDVSHVFPVGNSTAIHAIIKSPE